MKLQRERSGSGFAMRLPDCIEPAERSQRRGAIERLPKWLLCVPMVIQWLFLGLRYRSLTLPSVVNPAIETGGLAGESKAACLAQIGGEYSDFVAATVTVKPGQDAVALARGARMVFPLMAKPDIGWCGYGVQRVDSIAALIRYQASFPRHARFLLQDYVRGPGEAGLFYVRSPSAAKGRLIGITLRHHPCVVGDGRSTVGRLMAEDARLMHQVVRTRGRLGPAFAERVPALGEAMILSHVASLRVGGRYEDAMRLMTSALEERIDAIARAMPGFHFGRFDVRFSDIDALRGGNFCIIEVNGAGSEAIQFWDPSFGLLSAYRGVFAKQAMLFALGAEMRAAGHRPIGVLALARAWLAQIRLMRQYPPSN